MTKTEPKIVSVDHYIPGLLILRTVLVACGDKELFSGPGKVFYEVGVCVNDDDVCLRSFHRAQLPICIQYLPIVDAQDLGGAYNMTSILKVGGVGL